MRSGFRATITTFAPCPARRRAVTRPMPAVAPVTTTVLPCICMSRTVPQKGVGGNGPEGLLPRDSHAGAPRGGVDDEPPRLGGTQRGRGITDGHEDPRGRAPGRGQGEVEATGLSEVDLDLHGVGRQGERTAGPGRPRSGGAQPVVAVPGVLTGMAHSTGAPRRRSTGFSGSCGGRKPSVDPLRRTSSPARAAGPRGEARPPRG
jgi:hypothetical protein